MQGTISGKRRVLAFFLFFIVLFAFHIAIIANLYFAYAIASVSEKRGENSKGNFIEFLQGKVFRYYHSFSKDFVETLRVSYRKSVGYITQQLFGYYTLSVRINVQSNTFMQNFNYTYNRSHRKCLFLSKHNTIFFH